MPVWFLSRLTSDQGWGWRLMNVLCVCVCARVPPGGKSQDRYGLLSSHAHMFVHRMSQCKFLVLPDNAEQVGVFAAFAFAYAT